MERTIRPREYYFYNDNLREWSDDKLDGYSRAIWDVMSLIVEERDMNDPEICTLLKDIHKIDAHIDYEWSKKEAANENQ